MKNKTKQNKKESNESAVMGYPVTEVPATANDLKTALLVVSLTINVVVLITWLILQVTTQYDEQLAAFLFIR